MVFVPAIREGLEDRGGSPDSVCQGKIVDDKRDKGMVDDRLGMCKEKRRMGGFYVMLMSADVGGSADRWEALVCSETNTQGRPPTAGPGTGSNQVTCVLFVGASSGTHTSGSGNANPGCLPQTSCSRQAASI